jgi:hypothetical protein
VLVATHDAHMVDRMRRRVIELRGGQIIRDEASGLYAQRDQTTDEFSDMLDTAYGQLGRDQPTDDFLAPREPAPAHARDPHHPPTQPHPWTPGGGAPKPDPSSGGDGWRNYP